MESRKLSNNLTCDFVIILIIKKISAYRCGNLHSRVTACIDTKVSRRCYVTATYMTVIEK